MRLVNQTGLQVILHVFADADQVLFDLDPVLYQLFRFTDARQH